MASPIKVYAHRRWLAVTEAMDSAWTNTAIREGTTKQAVARRALAEYIEREQERRKAKVAS